MKSNVDHEDWILYEGYVKKRLARTRKNIEYIERSKNRRDEREVSESEYFTVFLENLKKEENDLQGLLLSPTLHFPFLRAEVGYLCDHLKCMQDEKSNGNSSVPWATKENKAAAINDMDILLSLLKKYTN